MRYLRYIENGYMTVLDARKFLEGLTAEPALEPVPLSNSHIQPSDLPVEWWQLWDERAEALALDDILKQIELAGITFLSDYA